METPKIDQEFEYDGVKYKCLQEIVDRYPCADCEATEKLCNEYKCLKDKREDRLSVFYRKVK